MLLLNHVQLQNYKIIQTLAVLRCIQHYRKVFITHCQHIFESHTHYRLLISFLTSYFQTMSKTSLFLLFPAVYWDSTKQFMLGGCKYSYIRSKIFNVESLVYRRLKCCVSLCYYFSVVCILFHLRSLKEKFTTYFD